MQHQREVEEKEREIEEVKRTEAQRVIDETAETERLRLADELFERTEELVDSRDKFTKAQKELADTEALIATRTGDAAETRRELTALKESESQLASRLDETKTECEYALEKAEQSRLSEVTTLTDQLSNNGHQLIKVVEELAESKDAMSSLAESLEREDKRAVQLEMELGNTRELYQTQENELMSTKNQLQEKLTLIVESNSTIDELNTSSLKLKVNYLSIILFLKCIYKYSISHEPISYSQDEITSTRDQLTRQERLTEEIRELSSKDKDEADRALMEQVRCANQETKEALSNAEKSRADKELLSVQTQSTIDKLNGEIVR